MKKNGRQILDRFFITSSPRVRPASSAFKKKEAFQSRIDSGRISSVCLSVGLSEIFSKSVNHRPTILVRKYSFGFVARVVTNPV